MAIQGASKTSCREAYEKLGVGCCNAEAQRRRVDVSFDLPQGWAWVRLRDLGTFTGGHTPSTSNRDLWGDEVLWVTSKDMKSKYINDTILKLTQLGAAELTMLKPNSIIMCTRSGILRRTFPVAIATQHLTINQDQRALTLYIPEMAEYIYDVLKAFESVILAHYKKAGTTVESIIWNRFTEIPIPMPPLPEQRRIIAKIEELFAIADSLGVAVDGLENAAKRLDKKVLDLAIRGKLVPQDPDDEPASELVKRIAASHKSPCKKQSELIHPPFAIPQSWEWVRLGAICEILDSKRKPVAKSKRKPGPYPYYGATCIQDFVSDFIFDEPLVLLGEDGAKWGKGDKSAFCVDGKIWVNNHAHVLRPCDGINHIYLVCTLDILDLMPYVTGTTVPKLNQEKMCDIQIPLPPLAEQKRIVAKIEELRAVIKPLTM